MVILDNWWLISDFFFMIFDCCGVIKIGLLPGDPGL